MCDTFVALPPKTQNGAVIFGKNSDREPNEMQALEYHPRRQHEPGAVLQCTYLAIPQVKETHAVWLGRPFWMWGAEFGVNEHGLAIGNEAVWTRMPIRKKGGLTGMDLLRLALERATTARQGLEVITGLLADFGQGGICGLYDRSMAYHNSYILADTQEAWVLETADHLWVAKQVKTSYAISNGLTIGAEYNLIHPDAIAHARREGLLKKGKDFDFADCYADWLYTTFSAQRQRRFQSDCFLRNHSSMNLPQAMELLRSHPNEPYRPDRPLLGNSICAHAGNFVTRNATQTTGSMACELRPGASQYWFTATSSPCLSVFKPVTFPPPALDLGPAASTYHPDSFWWRHERLYREVLQDFADRKAVFEPERKAFQAECLQKAASADSGELAALSVACFERHRQLIAEWTEAVGGLPIARKAPPVYRHYWRKMDRRAKIYVISESNSKNT
ncbi:MAG: C69 family dipeptidase [Saprospiraceae bacterium]|nr:C69 family dipeptidase [Saprospiraceae bacterium]